jgi:hypothetical protein
LAPLFGKGFDYASVAAAELEDRLGTETLFAVEVQITWVPRVELGVELGGS